MWSSFFLCVCLCRQHCRLRLWCDAKINAVRAPRDRECRGISPSKITTLVFDGSPDSRQQRSSCLVVVDGMHAVASIALSSCNNIQRSQHPIPAPSPAFISKVRGSDIWLFMYVCCCCSAAAAAGCSVCCMYAPGHTNNTRLSFALHSYKLASIAIVIDRST